MNAAWTMGEWLAYYYKHESCSDHTMAVFLAALMRMVNQATPEKPLTSMEEQCDFISPDWRLYCGTNSNCGRAAAQIRANFEWGYPF